MLWTDKVVQELLEQRQNSNRQTEMINDSWTPSGPVHVGSLMSPIFGDSLYRLLKEKDVSVSFQIGFDDFDTLDGIPVDLDREKYLPHMGKPLFAVPSEEEGKSFAEYYIKKYQAIQKGLGLKNTNYLTSEIYSSSRFDPFIKKAIESAEAIRRIYKEVSGSEKSDLWLPFQPICEKCGKLGTTEAIAFDGKKVKYVCRPNLVDWAEGCGYEGEISPFGGTGKMPWRVEWAAKWALFGVTFEAAGKDHANKGGSFDVSTTICEQVFASPPPYKLGHEFLTIEGKKMSSSKGLGFLGEQVLKLFGPEILRFVMLRTPPQRAIEFDLRNPNVVLKYFDEFDRFRSSENEEEREIYRLAAPDDEPYFVPRFGLFVQWVQMPNIDIRKEAEKLKGSELTERETIEVEKRAGYTKYWLEHYAPDEVKFSVKEELPDEFDSLTEKQKELLSKVSEKLGEKDADSFQNEIYQMGKELGLSSTETFQAIYKALIGKSSGPKAAHLILSLKPEFVKKRFKGEN